MDRFNNQNEVEDVFKDYGIDYDFIKNDMKNSLLMKDTSNKIKSEFIKLNGKKNDFLFKKRGFSERTKENISEELTPMKYSTSNNKQRNSSINKPTPNRSDLNLNNHSFKSKSRFSNKINQPKSHISVKSNLTIKSYNDFARENYLDLNTLKLIKLIGAGICGFSLLYYLYSDPNIDNDIRKISFLMKDNKKILVFLIAFGISAFLAYLVYDHMRTVREYEDLCKVIADDAMNDTLNYLKLQIENNNTSFIEENRLISILSENYGFDEERFIKDIYSKYLHLKLELNSSLQKRDLVEDGEIKVFWVFSKEGEVSENDF